MRVISQSYLTGGYLHSPPIPRSSPSPTGHNGVMCHEVLTSLLPINKHGTLDLEMSHRLTQRACLSTRAHKVMALGLLLGSSSPGKDAILSLSYIVLPGFPFHSAPSIGRPPDYLVLANSYIHPQCLRLL